MNPPSGTLPVAETFGPTFQGEGPFTGATAYFIRFGHCNLSCSWCDTAYTWDSTRFDLTRTCPPRTITSLINHVTVHPTSIVVFTGGEPLIWQKNPGFDTLITAISTLPHRSVHIETNGTIIPTELVKHETTWFSVSPKLSNSGDPKSRRINPDALSWFVRQAARGYAGFKFVCQTVSDVDEVSEFVTDFAIPPDTVWIMPEGTSPEILLNCHRSIASRILHHGYSTTTRLHTLLWNNDRGH